MSFKYSIVIPCYNEEKGLDSLLKAIVNFPKYHDVEFILVENGSTDGSRNIFKSRNEFDQTRIKSVFIDKNQGYGYGIKKGLSVATGDYVGWVHADLQLPLEDLIQFFDYSDSKSYGHLFMKGIRSNRPFIDSFFTFCMGVFESLLFQRHMYDVMAMPILFSRDMLESFDEFPDDFSIDIYVYVIALKNGYEIYRKPIHLKEREFGDSSWNTGLKSRVKQSKKMIDGSIAIRRKIK